MVDMEEVKNRVYEILDKVMDPEIPVISLTNLGIIRRVSASEDSICITISPTYTGCPATDVIPSLIVKALKEAGFRKISVKTELAPAWTTDWITEEGKAKLVAYGIAPPPKVNSSKRTQFCPNCNSDQTSIISIFGSTPCKSLHRCHHCEEPFEAFKCI